jgi:23S rRNA (guanine745-N1)-methyltransferase
VIDVGAGPGYYLARTLERLPGRIGLALDASRPAARRAARAHPRMAAIVCDAWRGLPARDAAAAVVLNVFAPRAGAEIARVLHPRGALVVATPTPRHLEELVGSLGLLTVDRSKQERLDRTLGRELRPAHRRECAWVMTLGHEDVRRLVGMGPSARHLDAAALDARLRALPDPVAVTASATVSVYRRVAEAGGNGR